MPSDRNILIATPAYGGNISTQTVVSVMQAVEEGRGNGWDVRYLPLIGSADIADTRNQVLGLFLDAKPCTDLLFVDADIGFSKGTLTHIMSHKVDLVGGVYRQRRDKPLYPVLWLEERNMIEDPDTGFPLIEVAGLPAGFLRITRKCVERMCGEGSKWIKDENKIRGIEYPFLFEWTWRKGDDGHWVRRSEDYSFCLAYRDVGGRVWADPALKLDHVGQKVFAGDFMKQLECELLAPGFISAA